MEATAFPQQNKVLGPPRGMTEDECRSLNVWSGRDGLNRPITLSCWKPTKVELDELLRTGRVWLWVYGSTMPPVVLTTENPWRNSCSES